jgi:hypothetical protein
VKNIKGELDLRLRIGRVKNWSEDERDINPLKFSDFAYMVCLGRSLDIIVICLKRM